MDMLLEQIINGLTLGSFYALVAIGYSMVYGVMKLINFAHGDLLPWAVTWIYNPGHRFRLGNYYIWHLGWGGCCDPGGYAGSGYRGLLLRTDRLCACLQGRPLTSRRLSPGSFDLSLEWNHGRLGRVPAYR